MLVSISRIERVQDHGGTVSGIFFAIWYITFPYISKGKKDKAITIFGKHLFFSVIIVGFVFFVSMYYFSDDINSSMKADILCGTLSVVIMSYIAYMFKSFS